MKSSALWALILASLSVLLGATAAHFWARPAAAPAIAGGTLLSSPREISDFTLTGDDGQPFTRKSLEGKWTVVFTGFTHCPDVCPTTLATLKRTVAQLGAVKDRLQVVFISIDPERDRPEQLASYVKYFDPSFRGATGPNAELDKLGRSLGFVYVKVPGTTPDNYTMDHSAALMLINPQGQVAGYFTPPLKAETLAGDLATVIKS